jgi:hypothetical protein
MATKVGPTANSTVQDGSVAEARAKILKRQAVFLDRPAALIAGTS